MEELSTSTEKHMKEEKAGAKNGQTRQFATVGYHSSPRNGPG
jgi:hypothetical protein